MVLMMIQVLLKLFGTLRMRNLQYHRINLMTDIDYGDPYYNNNNNSLYISPIHNLTNISFHHPLHVTDRSTNWHRYSQRSSLFWLFPTFYIYHSIAYTCYYPYHDLLPSLSTSINSFSLPIIPSPF
jgi:hypothetical protein